MSNLKKTDLASVKVIVFDLFDTLVYIKRPMRPYLELFDALSLTIEQRKEVRNLLLTTDTTNIFSAFPAELHTHLMPLVKSFHQKINQEINSTILFQDSLKTLEALKGRYSLFLISNLATQYKEVVTKLDLSNGQIISCPLLKKYFEDIFFSCDLGIAKPNREIFNLLKYPKDEILMIGNSYRSDYQGALMAGIKAVLLDRDVNISPNIKSALSINSLTELKKLLA